MMSSDLFEKLADLPVPPVPETFDRAVHERINSRLTVGQFLDFATRGLGFVLVHFARALADLMKVTVTGKFESGPHDGSRPAP
jgi:hypothetical protein